MYSTISKNLLLRRFFYLLSVMQLHIPFVALACIVGFVILFNKGLPRPFSLLPFYLLLTLTIEIIGWRIGAQGKNNTIYYNFFSIFSLIFYSYFIYHLLTSRTIKTIIIVAAIIWPVIALINLIFVQGLHQFNTMTYAISSMLIIIFCVCFFFELFKKSEALNLKRNPGFWFVTGLLFFNACTLPLLGLANYIYQFSPVLINNFATILTILNILLYVLFTIAFLCRKSNYPKYTSS